MLRWISLVPPSIVLATACLHRYTTSMASIPLSDILQLSVPDRIRLVQEIWSSIADEATSFPLSDDQQEEIDRRLDDLEANPDTGVPWEEVRARLLNRR